MIRTRIVAVLAAVTASVAALTACSTDQGAASRAAGQTGTAGTASEVRLAAAEIGSLGTVVVDQDSRTLYRFDRDSATPPESTCVDDCASKWPPVLVDDPADLQFDNVSRDLVATVGRTDGTRQLTLGGWPLYRFAEDEPGDANGHGLAGTWFAVTPDGDKVEAQLQPEPDPGGGY